MLADGHRLLWKYDDRDRRRGRHAFVAPSRRVSRTARGILIASPERQGVATRAYILIDTAQGRAPRIARTLRSVPEVEVADRVTGSCDLIAVVDAQDLSAVADLVTKRIHTIGGIVRITTCLAITSGRST